MTPNNSESKLPNNSVIIGEVHPEPHLMQGSFEPSNPASNMTHLPIGRINHIAVSTKWLYHLVTTNEVSPKVSEFA